MAKIGGLPGVDRRSEERVGHGTKGNALSRIVGTSISVPSVGWTAIEILSAPLLLEAIWGIVKVTRRHLG